MKRWSTLALAWLLAAGVAAAQPDLGYVQRLRMPSQSDALGHSRAVAADLHSGEIFVCDTRKQRIVIFDDRGLFRYQIPGGEVFRAPTDVAVAPEGTLLVLARHQGELRIVELDFDGRFIAAFALSGLPGESAPPRLVSLALDPAGERLYALDQANQRLWLAGRDGTVTGSVDLAADLSEKEAREVLLARLDVYGDTVLVAMPTAGVVRLYDLDGRERGRVGLKGTATCQSAFPVAAALDADGNVVVLDWQRMLFMVWDPRTNRCLGEHGGIGVAPGFFYQPGDLALDGAGRIYVSQGFEGRVQVFGGASPAAGTPAAGTPAAGAPAAGAPAAGTALRADPHP